MKRHRARNGIVAATVAALLAGTVAVLGGPDSLTAGAQPTTATVSATVASQPSGQPLPQSFVGVSLEYSALHLYAGRDPQAINPVLIELLRNLDPGQSPVVRIGGNSSDYTWWPIRGMIPPVNVKYALTEGWLQTAKAFASALGAKMILGINLAGGRPAVAVAEARALRQGIGRRYIEALEIGNEPDVYGLFPWFRDRRGRISYARPHSYSLGSYIRDFSRWRSALGRATPVAGPAFAELNWLSGLDRFIAAEPGLQTVTIHRYPLHGCLNNPNDPTYPSIANLLSDRASSVLAENVAPYVTVAHNRGLAFRVDELNSAAYASCLGRQGVSGTFASALWALDTLFDLANVGVDGVNVHTLPTAAYELFTFTHTSGGWEAFVHPEYYGMLLFTQAFPPGAQLLPVTVNPSGPLKVWATKTPDGVTRVVLINKDPSNAYQVQLQLPGLPGPARLERLQAPSVDSTDGVTLGGQSFGDQTTSGTLPGSPQTEPELPIAGTYSITVPPASAALLSP